MQNFIKKAFVKDNRWLLVSILVLVLLIITYGEMRRYDLVKQVDQQILALASTTDTQVFTLQEQIKNIVSQNNLLNNVVQTELVKNEALADQVEQVADTAVALDKLSKTDTQLLQKYSKVFFLNEHYEPSEITSIPSKYTYGKSDNLDMHGLVYPYLDKMFKDAFADDIDLRVISAYRSFGTQASLKSTYQVIYGAGTANQFSADQGYSEHQLGTTVDFTTTVLKDDNITFDQTEAFTWLKDNAYKYGFALSYPKNNSYYVYEPWHWRFVGVDLANKLHRENKYFYDLDQRVINNYLGVFFD
jgi:D-alanyl-D-alanine carboxypeptidase